MPRVAVVSGTCSVTKSACASSSSSVAHALGTLPSGSFGDGVVEQDAHAERLGEHAELRADVAVADDAERLAAHLAAVGGRLAPLAAMRRRRLRGKMPRISIMISPSTSSATLRVFENGALNTGTPRSRAPRRGATWLVPMQKQPTASSRSAAASTRGVTWVRERMPSTCTPAMRAMSSSSSSALGSTVTPV